MRKIFNKVEFDDFEIQKINELKQEISKENIEIPEKFELISYKIYQVSLESSDGRTQTL